MERRHPEELNTDVKSLLGKPVNQVAEKITMQLRMNEDVLRRVDLACWRTGTTRSAGEFAGGQQRGEKAPGGVHKGGTRPIQMYCPINPPQAAQRLFLMDYESQDGEVVTGESAAAAS